MIKKSDKAKGKKKADYIEVSDNPDEDDEDEDDGDDDEGDSVDDGCC